MSNQKHRPRIDRVTTTSGDGGQTSLADGHRYAKSHPRIELVGALDELNCSLGVARTHMQGEPAKQLLTIQSRIFDLGAAVATGQPQPFWERETARLTEWVNSLNESLEPLQEFVLPGNNEANALLHVARTVARRCERNFWALHDNNLIEASIGPFLNRLSDYLFTLARSTSEDEILWEPLQE